MVTSTNSYLITVHARLTIFLEGYKNFSLFKISDLRLQAFSLGSGEFKEGKNGDAELWSNCEGKMQ